MHLVTQWNSVMVLGDSLSARLHQPDTAILGFSSSLNTSSGLAYALGEAYNTLRAQGWSDEAARQVLKDMPRGGSISAGYENGAQEDVDFYAEPTGEEPRVVRTPQARVD